MAAARKSTPRRKTPAPRRGLRLRLPTRAQLLLWAKRGLIGLAAFYAAILLAFAVIPPPINLYQIGEAARLGGIHKDWVGWDQIAPEMSRAVVAAEDANFCLHWGFDMEAIRTAIDEGSGRGASTLSQQVVKNTYLWHGRSWARKALEAALTPVVEVIWTKRRILHVYLNTVEFDEGVFGVQAAARHYFDVDARDLTPVQASRLAAVLPDPKGRDAGDPSSFVRKRARAILAGAETIAEDGRADCFSPQD